MQTEKQRERLVELIKNAKNDKNLCWYDLYDLCSEDGCCAEEFADYLIANGVTVEIKQEEMTKIIMGLLKYAKSKNSVAVELQKDEYIYLLEYMQKAENVLKERNNEN